MSLSPSRASATLAPEVAAVAERHLGRLRDTTDGAAALAAADPRVHETIGYVFACSDFVAEACMRDPRLLCAPALCATDAGTPPYAAQAAAALTAHAGEADFTAWLRRWRQREFARIAWRDLAGWATLEETLAGLSAFADAAIDAAQRFALAELTARFGQPGSEAGSPQSFVIVGMGKLGGGELNFSSDIDLVFLYPEGGETDGPRAVSNEEFFRRLGQAVIRLLETPTADGIVFRVDMRLRPFGESGALAASFAAFEDYLQTHGRDWERYAWVKARAVTGADAYSEVRAGALRPFVFRRYLDFGVFESLREMKALIEREVERRDLEDDVKLGPGGIREIEFIVQAFQLIRGGQDRRLQQPSLLAVLPLLEGGKGLPRDVARELRSAYVHLRRLENRLQMLRDEQTHRLPAEPLARARIAAAMGAADWASLVAGLAVHRERVSRHFRSVIFSTSGGPAAAPAGLDIDRLWDPAADPSYLIGSVRQAGFAEPGAVVRLLGEFRDTAAVRRLDDGGRRRLRGMLPALLADVGRAGASLAVLKRALRVLEAIGSRSAYFALLLESATARRRLVEICTHGDFLASQVAAHPLLLDELLDERLFDELPDRTTLAADLANRMQHVADEDPEREVEALRAFQRAAVFRIAVADLTGRLPVMQVSDRLTDLAELIVGQAMRLAWQQMTAQYGVPRCGPDRRVVRICAVGYGKLGGIELGYGSDLDLVFLHNSTGDGQETDAVRPVDNGLFFVRLAQRIVHLLTVHSAAGRLYEVDVRLRPSGKGGMLITNIDAFAEYQRTEAWTWEHQSLLHARAVAGDASLCERFEAVRLATLTHHVRRETLLAEVRDMRVRMRREHAAGPREGFHLKRDAGGITDIEFLAQYWALQFARDYPPVVMFSDTIRELESVASADLVPQATVDVLTGAYRVYRARIHHFALEQVAPVVAAEEYAAERRAVIGIWERTFHAGEPGSAV